MLNSSDSSRFDPNHFSVRHPALMKRSIIWSFAVFAAAAAASPSHAFTINSNGIRSIADSDPEQSLARTWTISGSEPLESLSVSALGRVFVSRGDVIQSDEVASEPKSDNESNDDAVATITISSDSEDLLNLFEVISDQKNGIKLRLVHNHRWVYARGYVSTQITLAKANALRHVDSSGSADIAVGDNVIAQNSVSFSISGSGDIYLSTKEPISIDSLTLHISGSGDIQLQTPSLALSKALFLSISGSGDLAVVADSVSANELVTSLSGSGDLFVQTDDMKVQTLTTTLSGSGEITYSKSGTCVSHTIHVGGSGDIYAGSIVCDDTLVRLAGSGDVKVQVKHKLTTSSFYSGSIKYVGARPEEIITPGSNLRHYHGGKVEAATSDKFPIYHTEEPSHKPEFEVVMYENDFSTMSLSTSLSETMHPAVAALGLIAAFIALVTVRKTIQHRRQAPYSVLA